MRLVKRAEFLRLPEGTLYLKGVPWAFGNLSVKGETLLNDWYCKEVGWIDAPDGDDFGWLSKMENEGISLPIGDTYGRDGLFEEDAIFLILEREDLLHVRGLVDRALEISTRKKK